MDIWYTELKSSAFVSLVIYFRQVGRLVQAVYSRFDHFGQLNEFINLHSREYDQFWQSSESSQ
jgi:hypothetical protein